MAQQTIETTDTLPQGRTKLNANFTEVYSGLEGKAASTHNHDDRYYTEGEVDTALAAKAALNLTANTQTDDYTLVLSDGSNTYVRMNKGTAVNLTVPPNSSVAFATGCQIPIRAVGAGQVTVVAGVGVTINSPETLKLRKQGSTATLIKVGTNEWDLTGDLEEA